MHCRTILCGVAVFLFLAFEVLGLSAAVAAADMAGETDSILSVAESTFKAMKLRNYPELWCLLSRKSQDAIVGDVAKAVKKVGTQVEKKDVLRDFVEGGELSRAYWDSYLTAFDPEAVLEHSRWEMGTVGKKEAEIILQYQKAEQPARLKLFKEESLWRVGLEETFTGRRIIGKK